MHPDDSRIGSRHLFCNARFSVDDTLVYQGLIHTMLDQCKTVVDVGCGRGSYADDEVDPNNLFDLRGPDRQVIGMDVDPAAAVNPFLDEFRQLEPGNAWPTGTDSADLVVSDWTLEHVQDPVPFIDEVTRTLHVGGAFVARSISRYSLLSLISRTVPNRHHPRVLRYAQPARRAVDVFPAYYRMNTPRRLATLLADRYDYCIAHRPALENYVRARHPKTARVIAATERRLPEPMQMTFVLCAQLRRK